MRIIVIVVLLTVGLTSFCQEICDNGIDDDNDGFVDLNDSADCNCVGLIEPTSLIPNPSFEDTLCCPRSFDEVSCAESWIQASEATSDYFNTCGFLGDTFSMGKPAPPTKFNGKGFVGFHDMSFRNGQIYKEYVGACLSQSMKIGKEYKIDFYLAYGKGFESVAISLFASVNCTDLPFGGNDPFIGCPTNVVGWDELSIDTILLNKQKWNLVSMSFTPSKSYSVIVLGPSCPPVPFFQASNAASYCYLDHIIVNESDLFKSFQLEKVMNLCALETDLSIPSNIDNGSVQWYRNGIAIVGETSEMLSLSFTEIGDYQVRLDYGNSCVISSSFYLDSTYQSIWKMPELSIRDSLVKCSNERYLILDKKNIEPQAIGWYRNGVLLPFQVDDTLDCKGEDGVYTVKVTFRDSCIFSDTIVLEPIVLDTLSIELKETLFECDYSYFLQAKSNEIFSYFQWFENGNKIVENHLSILEISKSSNTKYGLIVFNQDSCPLSASYTFEGQEKEDPCPVELNLYNVFTTFKDGQNDTWKVDFEGYSNVHVDIYNRWGELVYGYNLPKDDDWNGRVNNTEAMCPGGTYFYILRLTNQYTDKVSRVNGIVELISEQ
jgi:gliding motility-associated-like protein